MPPHFFGNPAANFRYYNNAPHIQSFSIISLASAAYNRTCLGAFSPLQCFHPNPAHQSLYHNYPYPNNFRFVSPQAKWKIIDTCFSFRDPQPFMNFLAELPHIHHRRQLLQLPSTVFLTPANSKNNFYPKNTCWYLIAAFSFRCCQSPPPYPLIAN